LASLLKGWDSRLNHRLIEQYYLLAMRGVDKAIHEEFISPLWGDKYAYLYSVRWGFFGIPIPLPGIDGIGPPLAYFDHGPCPTRDEAVAYAEIMEEGPSAVGREDRQTVTALARQIQETRDEFEASTERLKTYQRQKEGATDKDRKDELQRYIEGEKQNIERLRERIEKLYAEYEKAKQAAGP
ncbi:MAG: hypothetical protein ABEK12_00835, partial [Candidatus Nanohaloarchaea archaeon]